MNHGCHLILTENGHQLQNTSSMEIKRPYKRCNEEKKEMAVSIPTSTINQVTMLVIFCIMLYVQFIIIITYTVNQFLVSCLPSAPPYHPHLKCQPNSTIEHHILHAHRLHRHHHHLHHHHHPPHRYFSSLELAPSP